MEENAEVKRNFAIHLSVLWNTLDFLIAVLATRLYKFFHSNAIFKPEWSKRRRGKWTVFPKRTKCFHSVEEKCAVSLKGMLVKNLLLTFSVTNRFNIWSCQWVLIFFLEQCTFVTGKQKHENCNNINFYNMTPCIVVDKWKDSEKRAARLLPLG